MLHDNVHIVNLNALKMVQIINIHQKRALFKNEMPWNFCSDKSPE
jgi:hypothetical protein